MGCSSRVCTADKIFLFINIAFAMYSGALLATAARLTWDPSTYTWFRFLCEAQYRVSAVYVAASGAWLAALVYLAAAAAASPRRRAAVACLRLYMGGVACLALSEVAYAAWMGTSLAAWWREAPQAALARRGMDLVQDLKPVLLAVHNYRDVALPVYEMIEEMERKTPSNAYVIVVFGLLGMVLQVAAFVMAHRLARRSRQQAAALPEKAAAAGAAAGACAGDAADDDSDGGAADSEPCKRAPRGWRTSANLRMYSILDKIF